MDYISGLRRDIIEIILCLVPIKEAARTSILSKKWRYNWRKIPKLVLDVDTVKAPFDGDDEMLAIDPTGPVISLWSLWRHKLLKVINHVLLMHQGPIYEFKLSLGFEDLEPDENCLEIDQIILQLSQNNATVKKLAIDLDLGCFCELQLSLFPLHQLTDLKLCQCHLVLQPEMFNGFSSLTSLSLKNVDASQETLHLVANCPLLKSFTLDIHSEISMILTLPPSSRIYSSVYQ